MYTSENLIPYSLSRLVRNHFVVIGSIMLYVAIWPHYKKVILGGICSYMHLLESWVLVPSF